MLRPCKSSPHHLMVEHSCHETTNTEKHCQGPSLHKAFRLAFLQPEQEAPHEHWTSNPDSMSFLFACFLHLGHRNMETQPRHHTMHCPTFPVWDRSETITGITTRLFMYATQRLMLRVIMCKTYLQHMNRNVQVQCKSRSIL